MRESSSMDQEKRPQNPIEESLQKFSPESAADRLSKEARPPNQNHWYPNQRQTEVLALDRKLKVAEDVIKRYMEGAKVTEIVKETRYPRWLVNEVLDEYFVKQKAEEVRKEVTLKAIEKSLPKLKSGVAMSLDIWNQKCQQILADPDGVKNLSVAEAKMFVDAASKCNEMARLEEGKSTQIEVVKYSIQQTRSILKELATIDPVFEYAEVIEVQDEPK